MIIIGSASLAALRGHSTTMRHASRRPPRLLPLGAFALALLGVASLVACRRSPERPAAGTGAGGGRASRLSQLLRQGARPGQLTAAERVEAERLVGRLLPPLTGPLAGFRWRVAYDDLPEADFVSIDLMEGDGENAPRAVWLHLLWRGALPAAERAAWALRLGRWPARGVEGHHLFVRLGGVELRAVADAADYRDPQRLRAVLERFDLDALSRL